MKILDIWPLTLSLLALGSNLCRKVNFENSQQMTNVKKNYEKLPTGNKLGGH